MRDVCMHAGTALRSRKDTTSVQCQAARIKTALHCSGGYDDPSYKGGKLLLSPQILIFLPTQHFTLKPSTQALKDWRTQTTRTLNNSQPNEPYNMGLPASKEDVSLFLFSCFHLIFSYLVSSCLHHIVSSSHCFISSCLHVYSLIPWSLGFLLWRSQGISLSQYPTLLSLNKVPRLTTDRIARSPRLSTRSVSGCSSRPERPRTRHQRLPNKMVPVGLLCTKVSRQFTALHSSRSLPMLESRQAAVRGMGRIGRRNDEMA